MSLEPRPFLAPFAPGGVAGIDEPTCRRLLAICLSQGGDYADLFFEYRRNGGFSFDEGILKAASRGVSMGLGVRVQRGDATGFAFVQDLVWESMKRAAETAARIATAGGSAVPVELVSQALPHRYDLTETSLDRPSADKRDLLQRASAAAQAHDPLIVRAEVGFSESIREVLIATSDGKLCFDVQPMIRFAVRAVAERDGARQDGSSGGGGRMSLGYFDDHSPEWHGERAAQRAIVMLDAKEAPAGQMPVVLAPGDSGILLHEAVGHGLEADFNRKGTSRYAGQIGETVASPLCTVVDDATLVQGRGSINVDDEGNEPGKSVLIDKGVLVGYLHDRLSARHFKMESTGNGRRESYAWTAHPRMTNTILLAGDSDPDEIVASVSRGIYAKRFGGGQVDISNGDFVFSLTESYLIEDGKLTYPLKHVNLIGSGPEVLSKVSMLGHDVEVSDGIWACGKAGQTVPVGVGCPTVKIDEITVGGTQLG
ncbi:MAG: metalloprotease TldD [Deltaproteobacteria bacterium]|nr:MAG: metalloprotease TldD [Deltaproteobacteria bacterium]